MRPPRMHGKTFLDKRRRPNRQRRCGPPGCIGYHGRFGARRGGGGGGHVASRRVAREMATPTHPTDQTCVSLGSGHLHMPNIATAPAHRAALHVPRDTRGLNVAVVKLLVCQGSTKKFPGPTLHFFHFGQQGGGGQRILNPI